MSFIHSVPPRPVIWPDDHATLSRQPTPAAALGLAVATGGAIVAATLIVFALLALLRAWIIGDEALLGILVHALGTFLG